MDLKVAKHANFKQIAGVAVAAIILTVIFVPFQTASAFTVNLNLPNVTDPNAVPTSAVGSTFKVTIDVEAGELISIESVEVILDNGEPGVKRAIFDSNGNRTSGDSTLVRGHITITQSASSTTGYGYGYGIVSDGTTFNPNYSYAFTYSYAFLGGNNVGYSNVVGNSVAGLVGPGTITISGKLNTALMQAGVPHTLDVLINTGTNANPDHLVAPQLTFTTVGNSNIHTEQVTPGPNKQVAKIIPGKGTVTVTLSDVLGGGTLTLETSQAVFLRQQYLDALGIDIFTSVSGQLSKFAVTGASASGVDYFDIDASSVTLGPGGFYTLVIPYDENQLPAGLAEANIKLYHFNVDTGQWENITQSVDTVANTVTGKTTSLSPLVIGYFDSSVSTSSGSVGGGGGGGGGFGVIVNQTFPPDFFLTNPLMKVQLQEAKFLNAQGQTVFGGKAGQQLSISANFRNYQQTAQPYAIIVQVIDKDGITTDLSWITGVADGGGNANTSRSLTLGSAGEYSVKVFVWDGVSMAPSALSEVTSRNLIVTN
jgi:hypothetical protein